MKIIGINAPMGGGKSTAIECLRFILRDTKCKVKLVKFAEPIYDIQEYAYRRISQVYARPATFVKDRKFLQYVGGEWGRGLDKELWIKLLQMEVKQAANEHTIFVSDDTRYPNEAEAIRAIGGKVLKIIVDPVIAAKRIPESADGIPNHPSEAGITDALVDFRVDNSATKSEFQDRLIKLFPEILASFEAK